MTFGFGDEMEAYFRSEYNGTNYKDELTKVRSEIEEFRKAHPGKALTAEIAGSFLIPGWYLTKLAKYLPSVGKIKEGSKIKNTMKRMVIGGATGGTEGLAYGMGTGKGDITERFEGNTRGKGRDRNWDPGRPDTWNCH